MKWRMILCILFAQLSLAANAQHLIDGKYLPEPYMVPNTKTNLYGYVIYREVKGEGKKFHIWIPCQYEEAHPFVKAVGRARVKTNKKYGFINTSGGMVIPARFDEADNFDNDGYCRVKLDGKYGLINDSGDFVVPPKYDAMENLLNGWYEVAQGDVWGYVFRTNVYVSTREEYVKKRDAGIVAESR